jgi:hypothetical protein
MVEEVGAVSRTPGELELVDASPTPRLLAEYRLGARVCPLVSRALVGSMIAGSNFDMLTPKDSVPKSLALSVFHVPTGDVGEWPGARPPRCDAPPLPARAR